MSGKTSTQEVVDLYYRHGGNIRATARDAKLARSTVRARLAKAGVDIVKPIVGGYVDARIGSVLPLPKRGVIRYLVTCAQNNTHIYKPVWKNLMALAKHYGIPKRNIKVSTFTYNQNAYGKMSVKKGRDKDAETDLWYDKTILPYLCDDMIDLAPNLTFCGHMNIPPTATNPLSGYETYTGRNSSIFPHVKLAVQSVPSGLGESVKFMYTTGTVTQRNYIQKNAGIKAERWHKYGALLVEVCADGSWYTRHVTAGKNDDICDLTVRVSNGRIYLKQRVESISWGDVHEEQMCDVARQLAWGETGLYDLVRPRYQFMNDTGVFERRSHHNRKDPETRFQLHIEGKEDVTQEYVGIGELLNWIDRPWCETIMVDSNHDDQHLRQWIRETDHKTDHINAEFYLELALEIRRAIRRKEKFSAFEWAVRNIGRCPDRVSFLDAMEPFLTSRHAHEGIDHVHHGHIGVNGSRGSTAAFRRVARRLTKGHDHSFTVLDDVWSAGHLCDLRKVKYQKGGFSTWSQTSIIEYSNGERAGITFWKGRFCADMKQVGG